MLCCKHNRLSSEELTETEKVMNSYLDEQWPADGLRFSPWAYSRATKQGILLAIFKGLNVLTVLELSASSMLDFCLDIEALYNNVPYHSFNHAVDVVVKLYYMLHDLHAAAYLASYDIAALLISALCHDCGHPGMNNLFQKNANTELAQRYPDAILERYSVDLAVGCIEKHGLLRNVENLRDPVYSDRTTVEADVASRMLFSIRSAILATDMTRHFGVVEDCRSLVSVLLKKARRLADKERGSSEHGASPKPTSPPGASTSTPPWSYTRSRSPSEPTAPMKQLLSYSIQEASRTAARLSPVPRKHSPALSASARPQHAEAGTRSIGSASPASATSTPTGAQSRIKRLHIRRSASMSDGLLDSTQRQTLINILLHAVDVFNPVLPWPMCKKWSDLMNAESFLQGDREKQLSLPVSPNMDRNSTDQRQVSLDFGNIIIRPFFTELVSLFPVDDTLLPALEANMQKWSRLSTDTTHEISSPAGANNHVYSWPVEPMDVPSSLSSSSSRSEGRRLSIAAGTVDIPPSRLEAIRRHSHEGFEALHRGMVGHMFSKHLVQIQERRKASYILGSEQQQQQQQLQAAGHHWSPPSGGGLTTRPLVRNLTASILSPVTEAPGGDDAPGVAPSSAGSNSEPIHQNRLPAARARPDMYVAVRGLPPLDRGPASASWETSGAGRSHSSQLRGSFAQPGAPMPSAHLSSYCIESPVCSPRQHRSTSLDPTLLARLPTAYPSLAGDGSHQPTSPKHPSDR